ncbi:MAG: alpha/beta fold hydrolase, partial [Chloroflexi bacterium]|nr:alpha/beta fold hydrolase [Chloroflexota bacterium]
MSAGTPSSDAAPINAGWIDPALYPYTSQTFQVPAGTMRYLDEGQGQPIVMVHGNPVWSFVYRKLVAALRDKFRCIAPDHIGFGQSDKPADWSYLPQEHAANLERLLESLDLDGITLVVQDWGGPVGLSYAIAHPERVQRLVILNTWLWPVDDDWYYRAFSGIVGGPLGRLLCRRINLFVRFVVPTAYGDRRKLTKEIHRHYFDALPTPDQRNGTWVFPQQIIGSTAWLGELWAQRARLAEKPALLAWGMKDIAFREKELKRWMQLFPQAEVTRFPEAGHY